jgi:hypothetical protein
MVFCSPEAFNVLSDMAQALDRGFVLQTDTNARISFVGFWGGGGGCRVVCLWCVGFTVVHSFMGVFFSMQLVSQSQHVH